MKKLVLLMFVGTFCLNGHAQWSNTADNTTSGSIGIGSAASGSAKAYLFDSRTNATPLIVRGTFPSASAFHHSFITFTGTGYVSNDVLTETSLEYAKNWHIGIASSTAYYNESFFSIYNKGQRRMIITTSGNVGVGVDPQVQLEVPANTQIASYKTYLDSPIEPANGYTRSNFGSNVLWDASSDVWLVKAIGANDFSAIIHPNQDGLAFMTASSTGNTPRPLGHSEFMGYERMRISASGRVGIGTSNPVYKLDVRGGIVSAINYDVDNCYTFIGRNNDPGVSTDAYFYHRITSNYHILGTNRYGGAPYRKLGFAMGGGDVESDVKMTIDFNGNVGIGSSNPDAKLAVNGTVHAKEVKVDLDVQGPDYVFEEDYELPSLESIRGYIEKHKHLPEIPSAKDMEINGILVGEMNMLLLKKVEELTLYMIELKSENETLTKRVSKLEE